MTMTELLLLIIAVGGAGYVGYLLGRYSVIAEQGSRRSQTPVEEEPLPGPRDYDEAPTRRSSPPPATAGAGPGSGQAGPVTRRSSVAPPPARAGLLDTGAGRDPAKKGK